MAALSAGILMWRRGAGSIEVLLVHPGGPFWRGREAGAWSIPKGAVEEGEALEAAARREFAEELGHAAEGPLLPLGRVRQTGGKVVEAFALEGDLNPAAIRSNTFELEWPPHSGRRRAFPEVDRAAWFSLTAAHTMILAAQGAFLDRLAALLGAT